MIPLVYQPEETVSEPTPVSLRAHHEYRSWTTDWYDDTGRRRSKRFGREGSLSEREAKARFRNWKRNEYDKRGTVRNPDGTTRFTIHQLCQAYLDYAAKVYVKNGEQTAHMNQVRAAMTILNETFGHLDASSLTNPKVAGLRDEMIRYENRDGTERILSLKTVNGRLHSIKAAYRWARERDLVTREALADILAVTPLRRGRSEAKDPKPIRPVEQSRIDAARAHLPPTVAAMVDLQLLTGMRPGEVCLIRPCDIEKRKGVWLYRPHTHKLEHKEKSRVVALGPQAQAIVRAFWTNELTTYLFSPANAQQERRNARTLARKTPANEGNAVGTNRKAHPKRTPGELYDCQSYRKAIRHACRAEAKATGKPFPSWHPNQLRHNYATMIGQQYGIEAVADLLGHSNLQTPQIYAERSVERAIKVARKVG